MKAFDRRYKQRTNINGQREGPNELENVEGHAQIPPEAHLEGHIENRKCLEAQTMCNHRVERRRQEERPQAWSDGQCETYQLLQRALGTRQDEEGKQRPPAVIPTVSTQEERNDLNAALVLTGCVVFFKMKIKNKL